MKALIGYTVLSLLLAVMLTYAAVRKLSHHSDVVMSYARVGVPERALNPLAMLLIAGAVGIVVGIFVAPIGIAAAGCLVAYFAVATGAHVGHRDLANVGMPVVMLALAGVALALRLS